MPATAASRYCSGFSESSLWVTSEPSGRLATTSVKVPPRSIQNCQPDDEFMILSPQSRQGRNLSLRKIAEQINDVATGANHITAKSLHEQPGRRVPRDNAAIPPSRPTSGYHYP